MEHVHTILCVRKLVSELKCCLPNGWVVKFKPKTSAFSLVGPNGSSILFKPKDKSTDALLTGSWPVSSRGELMDPYSWGVLDITAPYPFMRIDLKRHNCILKTKVLSFIGDYQEIYSQCWDKRMHQTAIAV